jgi:hypothetical protein
MTDDPPPGSGRPRLVVVPDGGHASVDGIEAHGYEAEFPLELGRTTIGSAPDQDIVLEDIAPAHAVVEWSREGDEFVFVPATADGSATVDGNIASHGLHHGDRLQVGAWTLVFQRDEDSDHIRRDRARQGGQYAGGGVSEAGGHSTETE